MAWNGWTESKRTKLEGLGNYYAEMKTICEELYTTGTTSRKTPTKPNVGIIEFLPNSAGKKGHENKDSLRQLSDYLEAKICREQDYGWQPLSKPEMEDDVDALIFSIAKGNII
jgi:hypothetical protein